MAVATRAGRTQAPIAPQARAMFCALAGYATTDVAPGDHLQIRGRRRWQRACSPRRLPRLPKARSEPETRSTTPNLLRAGNPVRWPTRFEAVWLKDHETFGERLLRTSCEDPTRKRTASRASEPAVDAVGSRLRLGTRAARAAARALARAGDRPERAALRPDPFDDLFDRARAGFLRASALLEPVMKMRRSPTRRVVRDLAPPSWVPLSLRTPADWNGPARRHHAAAEERFEVWRCRPGSAWRCPNPRPLRHRCSWPRASLADRQRERGALAAESGIATEMPPSGVTVPADTAWLAGTPSVGAPLPRSR
jgi:hypothetical protein